MRTDKQARQAERGIALLIALVLVFALSALAASIIFVTNTEAWTSVNHRSLTQARYVAETGTQNAMYWFTYNYVPPANAAAFDLTKSPVQFNGQPVVLSAMSGVASNYPDPAQQNAFNAALNNVTVNGMGTTANYSVTATLLRMRPFTQAFSGTPGLLQTWQITAQGNTGVFRRAQVQVTQTLERTANPFLNYALYATGTTCGTINTQTTITTDSYNSNNGTYAATRQNTGGDVGTAGNYTSSGSTTINGSLATPYGNTTGACGAPMKSLTGAATITDGMKTLSPTPVFPNPTIPVTPTTAYTAPAVWSPGTYGNVTITGPTHVRAGTYNVNSINAPLDNSNIIVDSGPVIINVGGVGIPPYPNAGQTGVLDFQGTSSINTGGKPSDVQIVYGGTANITIEERTTIAAVIYAPNANLNLIPSSGLDDFYGAVIVKTMSLRLANASFHYDQALAQNFLMAGPYQPVSFSWSKY